MKKKSSVEEINRQIGQNIKQERTLRGITKEALGESLLTPVTQQAVSKWEAGKAKIPASTLVEVARVLDCGLVKILNGVERHIPEIDTSEKNGNLRLYKNLNEIDSKEIELALANLTKAIHLELSNNFRRK